MKAESWYITYTEESEGELYVYFDVKGVDKYVVEFDGETEAELSRREVMGTVVADFIKVPVGTTEAEIEGLLNAKIAETPSRPRTPAGGLVGREGRPTQ